VPGLSEIAPIQIQPKDYSCELLLLFLKSHAVVQQVPLTILFGQRNRNYWVLSRQLPQYQPQRGWNARQELAKVLRLPVIVRCPPVSAVTNPAV